MLRLIGQLPVAAQAAQLLHRLNARHPWSHNDFFHSWILANLPIRRNAAVDIGCGEGSLVEALASHFEQVVGTDVDASMRNTARSHNALLENVTVVDRQLDSWPADSFDLITMVAVLHHMNAEQALEVVRRTLAPGGRLLIVGLAPPSSVRDHLWDAVSAITNPIIGYVHHPWPSSDTAKTPTFPVRDPHLSFDQVETIAQDVLPGSTMRHRIGFRFTLEWTKPATGRM